MTTNRPSRVERNSHSDKKRSSSQQGGSNGGGNGGGKSGKKKKKISTAKVLWTMFFTIALAIFCAVAGYLYITVSGQKYLQENEGKLFVYETSKVYDRNGQLMGELSVEKSEPVKQDEIPDLLKKAFIATEDRRFMEHNGVDLWSIGRAAVKDIMARAMVEGGSTITQQLAKNIFLTSDKTFFRKATEMSIAMALERQKTKDEILTLYLNRINFGGSIYGIKAASIRYFGQPNLKELKLWQMATLAAMPKGPSKYNPVRNPELSQKRRGVVLDLMEQEGYITAAQRDEAKAVVYDYVPPVKNEKYLAFKDYVVQEVEEKYGLTEDELNRGGYKIYTTMDAKAQTAVEKAFEKDSNFEKSKDDQQVQAAITIINHENGSLVALLGGRDYQRKGFSRLNSQRQPGSAFKPIVSYAPALDTGAFQSSSMLNNEKQCFGNYCPRNLHGYSKTIDMTTAITKSENIPAVWLLNQIGVKTGVKYAKEMGITLDKNDSNLAIALGGLTKGTNTLEMAGAFSTMANLGQYNEPYSVKSIKDHSGKEVFKHTSDPKQVLKEKTAYEMTKMLQNVVNDGTGRKAKIDRPVAGKTGTTQHGIKGLNSSKNRDVWFVGYTPEWTAAIWMGYDKPDKNHLLNGSSGQAAALFGKIMKEALDGVPRKEFPVPKNMEPDPPKEEPKNTSPTNLTATYNPDTSTVALSWTPAGEGEAIYHIFRKATGETEFTHYLDSKTPAAEDISVVEGNSYQYYVTLYDAVTNTESTPSNTISVDIDVPEPPVSDPDPNPDNGNPNNGTDNSGTPSTPGTPDQGNGTNSGHGQSESPNMPDQGNGTGTENDGQSGGGNSDGTVIPDRGNNQNESGHSDDSRSSDPPTGGTDGTTDTGN